MTRRNIVGNWPSAGLQGDQQRRQMPKYNAVWELMVPEAGDPGG